MLSVESSVALTSVQNVGSSDPKKEGWKMGSVLITYKIFPTGVEVNFDNLKRRIEENLPNFATTEGYGEEPIAYGLKALLVQVKFPEDKTGVLDEFEKSLEKISDISQVETLMVRRTSR